MAFERFEPTNRLNNPPEVRLVQYGRCGNPVLRLNRAAQLELDLEPGNTPIEIHYDQTQQLCGLRITRDKDAAFRARLVMGRAAKIAFTLPAREWGLIPNGLPASFTFDPLSGLHCFSLKNYLPMKEAAKGAAKGRLPAGCGKPKS